MLIKRTAQVFLFATLLFGCQTFRKAEKKSVEPKRAASAALAGSLDNRSWQAAIAIASPVESVAGQQRVNIRFFEGVELQGEPDLAVLCGVSAFKKGQVSVMLKSRLATGEQELPSERVEHAGGAHTFANEVGFSKDIAPGHTESVGYDNKGIVEIFSISNDRIAGYLEASNVDGHRIAGTFNAYRCP